MLSASSFRLLLTIISLLYNASDSVAVTYYVVPDDYTNSSANTLLHYMNNSEEYFSSHTKLQFLPGTHYLANNLVVSNVKNFSLYGDAVSTTTIYCDTPATIAFIYSKNVNINNLTIKNCGNLYIDLKRLTDSLSSLILLKCSDFAVYNCVFECDYQQCGLVLFDTIGYSRLNNIKSGQLLLVHSSTTGNVTTDVSYFEQCGCCSNDTAIKIIMYPHLYEVKVYLFHIKLNLHKPLSIYSSNCEGQNFINIKQIKLMGTIFSHHLIDIKLDSCKRYYGTKLGSAIQIVDCDFTNISGTGVVVYVEADLLGIFSALCIINSSFRYIKANIVLQRDLRHVMPN